MICLLGIEMGTVLTLAKMELDGIGVSTEKLNTLVESFTNHIHSIERKAYELAGRSFSFTSSKEVAKVLGMYRGKKVSTSKQVLQEHEHPIAKLVLNWRKLNGTLTKMIYPLLRVVENGRIYGNSITHNATGRISMHEPNLQNIAKDFELVDPITKANVVLSCRGVFTASGSNVFLSADYCQLELRLLAHYSQDAILCNIMRSNKDVFKLIAAQWYNINENVVDGELRQRAKQLCYGIIYGMGIKTLAEQMAITEEEANELVNTFHAKYKSLKQFVQTTIANCKENGYVMTLAGRKRYLPNINHKQYHIQSNSLFFSMCYIFVYPN